MTTATIVVKDGGGSCKEEQPFMTSSHRTVSHDLFPLLSVKSKPQEFVVDPVQEIMTPQTQLSEHKQQRRRRRHRQHRPKKLDWNKGIRGKLYDRSHQKEELVNAMLRRTKQTIEIKPTATTTTTTEDDDPLPSITTTATTTITTTTSPAVVRELVLITGPAGVGKTSLVTSCLRPMVDAAGGYLISGKFDSIQHPEAFVPFVQAFTQWALQVQDRGSEACWEVKHRVEHHGMLAESIQALTDLIPALAPILGGVVVLEEKAEEIVPTTPPPTTNATTNTTTTMTATTRMKVVRAQQNFIFMFCRFVAAICTPTITDSAVTPTTTGTATATATTSTVPPLVLFLDDLQWAEPASLELLSALVQESVHIPGLMIVGACRGNEVSPHDPLSVTLRSLESDHGAIVTNILVGNLCPDAVQHMVSDMLNLDAVDHDKSQPLADFIYRQTEGNAFFSLQFLRRLLVEGFLFRDEMTSGSSSGSSMGGTVNVRKKGEEEVAIDEEEVPLEAEEEEEEEDEEKDPDRRTPPVSPPLLKGHDGTFSNFNMCVSWKWYSEEVILQSIACSDVAQMVTETILSLPPEQQYVLKVGACLGADFDEYSLHEVCQDADVITKTLNDAEEKGILSTSGSITCETVPSKDSMTTCEDNGTSDEQQILTSSSSMAYDGGIERHGWRFTHDMIHTSVYSLIDEPNRAAFHLHVGRKLWASATASSGPDHHESIPLNIFGIVNQLKQGIDLVTDEEERYRLAVLYRQAGEKATIGSSFQVAASYLNLAVDLLGRRHWRDHYHLSLDLFNAAAEVEYCNANFSRMDFYLDEVLTNARCFRDKLQAYTTKVYSLGTRGEMHHAIDIGLEVLKKLGEPFPKKTPGLIRILFEYAKTKRMLNKFPQEEDILNLPSMVNDDKLAATRLLVLLFPYAINCRPEFAVLIAFWNVRLVLTHGLSSM
jgi:predicted ATPase